MHNRLLSASCYHLHRLRCRMLSRDDLSFPRVSRERRVDEQEQGVSLYSAESKAVLTAWIYTSRLPAFQQRRGQCACSRVHTIWLVNNNNNNAMCSVLLYQPRRAPPVKLKDSLSTGCCANFFRLLTKSFDYFSYNPRGSISYVRFTWLTRNNYRTLRSSYFEALSASDQLRTRG